MAVLDNIGKLWRNMWKCDYQGSHKMTLPLITHHLDLTFTGQHAIVNIPRRFHGGIWKIQTSMWKCDRKRKYQEILTTGQKDAGQSDPHVPLWFAGDTIRQKHDCSLTSIDNKQNYTIFGFYYNHYLAGIMHAKFRILRLTFLYSCTVLSRVATLSFITSNSAIESATPSSLILSLSSIFSVDDDTSWSAIGFINTSINVLAACPSFSPSTMLLFSSPSGCIIRVSSWILASTSLESVCSSWLTVCSRCSSVCSVCPSVGSFCPSVC